MGFVGMSRPGTRAIRHPSKKEQSTHHVQAYVHDAADPTRRRQHRAFPPCHPLARARVVRRIQRRQRARRPQVRVDGDEAAAQVLRRFLELEDAGEQGGAGAGRAGRTVFEGGEGESAGPPLRTDLAPAVGMKK